MGPETTYTTNPGGVTIFFYLAASRRDTALKVTKPWFFRILVNENKSVIDIFWSIDIFSIDRSEYTGL